MTSADPVEEGLEHLRRLPFVEGIRMKLSDLGTNLEVLTPAGTQILHVELHRSHLKRETAQFIVHQARPDPSKIVVAPVIGRQIGELFEQARINFIDTAGNCYLNFGDRYVARIQGRKPGKRKEQERGLRAPAYRVLFTLLVRPTLLSETARAIAEPADVSPQTANAMRRRLIDDGFVFELGGRRVWAPDRKSEALAMWVSGYATTLAPSILIDRYRYRESDAASFERRVEPILDELCRWGYGGGAAAMRLTRHYRGDRTTIYLAEPPPDIAGKLQLVRDPAGPLVMNHAPGAASFDAPVERCVHPLLVYADLLAERNERANDAASVVFDECLERAV